MNRYITRRTPATPEPNKNTWLVIGEIRDYWFAVHIDGNGMQRSEIHAKAKALWVVASIKRKKKRKL